MRFFKSFKLLHRRTKSDPTNAIISDFQNHKPTPSICNGISGAIYTNPHPNLRILDLEAENSRLRDLSTSSLQELTETKSLLQDTQADLYAELHRGARQRKEDRNEIERLRQTLAQYETFSELLVNANPHWAFLVDVPVNLRDGDTVDQALSNAVECAATTAKITTGDVVSSVLGPRTQDEYMSALRLSLKSRMQLRKCKKIAKFWKNTAKQDGKNPDIITPSVSTISSIDEALPAERQKAVEDLIARRRAAAESSHSNPVSTSTRDDEGTTTSITEVSAAPGSAIVHSLPHGRPCLSPLASQSLRKELNEIASTNRIPKWPYAQIVSRKPMSQVDLNLRNTTSIACSQAKRIKPTEGNPKSKAPILPPARKISGQRKEKRSRVPPSSEPDPFALVHTELMPSQHPPTNGVTRTTPDSSFLGNTVNSARSHSLSSISEESEPLYESCSISNDTSQEWITCDSHKGDDSFDSTAETLIHTSPSPPAPRHAPCKIEISKSKLPIPVFRSLKRLSSTKLAARGKTTLPPPGTRATAKVSPTRLPVRSNAKSR